MGSFNIEKEDMYMGLAIGFSVIMGVIIILCLVWRCCCHKAISATHPRGNGRMRAWENNDRSGGKTNELKSFHCNTKHLNKDGKVRMNEAHFLQKYI